jgi:inorganic pyrophosphatase
MRRYILLSFLFISLLYRCEKSGENSYLAQKIQQIDETTLALPFNLHKKIVPLNNDSTVNVFVEIPAGFTDKWEVSKTGDLLKWDIKNGAPRIVDYLGYPGNYGMIPGTLLSQEQGGDGDPLDIIVLGSAVARGSIIRAKIIGILHLTDNQEQDDKLIAVQQNTPMYRVSGMRELRKLYPGVTEIIQLWFIHYKKGSTIESAGFGDASAARSILWRSIESYKKMLQKSELTSHRIF